MISSIIEITKDADDLHKIFLSEKLISKRANCKISKNKTLKFQITAKDPVSMKALTNSILNIIQVYQKTKNG